MMILDIETRRVISNDLVVVLDALPDTKHRLLRDHIKRLLKLLPAPLEGEVDGDSEQPTRRASRPLISQASLLRRQNEVFEIYDAQGKLSLTVIGWTAVINRSALSETSLRNYFSRGRGRFTLRGWTYVRTGRVETEERRAKARA